MATTHTSAPRGNQARIRATLCSHYPPSRYSSAVMHRERGVWAVGLCLVALQLPFVLTQHIQEDAYITFRSAANLADLHVYGFNPGERVSASTSHLSVFVVALLRKFTGDAFIPATQLLYGVATIVGLY